MTFVIAWSAHPCSGKESAGHDGNTTTVLTGADRRPVLSLNGEWASIVDPYFSGLFSFHHEEKANGWFLNRKAKPDDSFPTEYDLSKSPQLKVPGDWNTQRESLFYHEGPMWNERDFTYSPKEDTHVYLHVGAANYRVWFWVNEKKVCEHEGGFTSFNCEVTSVIHAGPNFVVTAVDNTRHEDNAPTLQTDWWNYGGLYGRWPTKLPTMMPVRASSKHSPAAPVLSILLA